MAPGRLLSPRSLTVGVQGGSFSAQTPTDTPNNAHSPRNGYSIGGYAEADHDELLGARFRLTLDYANARLAYRSVSSPEAAASSERSVIASAVLIGHPTLRAASASGGFGAAFLAGPVLERVHGEATSQGDFSRYALGIRAVLEGRLVVHGNLCVRASAEVTTAFTLFGKDSTPAGNQVALGGNDTDVRVQTGLSYTFF